MRPPKYNVSIFFINWRNVIRYTWLPSRRSSLLYIKNQLDTSLKLKPVAELWKIYKKALRQGRTFGDEGGEWGFAIIIIIRIRRGRFVCRAIRGSWLIAVVHK